MKKMMVALVVLAAAIGMASADSKSADSKSTYFKTVVTYYNCGRHQRDTQKVTTNNEKENGTIDRKILSTECPTCKAEKEAAEAKRNQENACNVLMGANKEAYNAAKENGYCK